VAGFELFAFIIGIIWVIFPLAVIHFMGKQREANRVIAQHLDAIRHEMEEMAGCLEFESQSGSFGLAQRRAHASIAVNETTLSAWLAGRMSQYRAASSGVTTSRYVLNNICGLV